MARGCNAVFTATSLRFGGSLRGDETRFATLAAMAYDPSRRVTLHAGAGALVAGHLAMPDGGHDFSSGPAAAVGVSWRIIEAQPFVVLSSLLSFSAITTRSSGNDAGAVGYEAFDLRLGVLVGARIVDGLSTYAVARAFGGPVFWRYAGDAVTGTDVAHYQLGAGLSLTPARALGIFVEGVPFGERAVSTGLLVAL